MPSPPRPSDLREASEPISPHAYQAKLRKQRRREVRKAEKLGLTVPYSLGTLIDDGHSLATIRAVARK